MRQVSILLLLVFTLISCKNKIEQREESVKKKPTQIVLISNYAPKPYIHYLKQDSIGGSSENTSGAFSKVKSPSFVYFDSQHNTSVWNPKVSEIDTLVIPYYKEYLEISTSNVYTKLPNTFLVKNGDTLVIDYKHNIPVAKITNRNVTDIELNYNNYRVSELFNNKYPSHHKVFLGFFLPKEKSTKETIIDFYEEAIKDEEREIQFLDSLYNQQLISKFHYKYRKSILRGLTESHKNNKTVKKYVEQRTSLLNKEDLQTTYSLDLSETDSLMTYTFFRDYLNSSSKYNLPIIQENNTSSGSFYTDSRIRFDSILNDSRFNQTAKNFLLPIVFTEIGRNFKLKDKKKYFDKLTKNTTNHEKINELQRKYKLDFSKSDKLMLTNLETDTLTFSNVLKNNKGKWLYIDFWASWCAPCRKTMPAAKKLKKELEKENITFIYLALNDSKKDWKKAIESDGISDSQNYFIENGTVSKVIEDLRVKSIPHYLIYNPNGELVNGFANRPGQGAKEQLKKLIAEHNGNSQK